MPNIYKIVETWPEHTMALAPRGQYRAVYQDSGHLQWGLLRGYWLSRGNGGWETTSQSLSAMSGGDKLLLHKEQGASHINDMCLHQLPGMTVGAVAASCCWMPPQHPNSSRGSPYQQGCNTIGGQRSIPPHERATWVPAAWYAPRSKPTSATTITATPRVRHAIKHAIHYKVCPCYWQCTMLLGAKAPSYMFQ